ncbi:MAG: class II aldolase/adducin family protein [Promethearchaeia archaeon]
MSSDSDKELLLKKEVVKAAKAIYQKGLVENNEGNVSVRNGKKEEIFITPTANQYEMLTEDQIVHLAFDGTPLSSGKLPSTEAKLHLAIYKARPKVRCVIHTHSTYATIVSVVRKSIPILMEEQVIYLGGAINIAPYGEAHTQNLAESALKALSYKNGSLLANHGVIVCGKSTTEAIKFAELIEKLAKIYWGALHIGEPFILDNQNLEQFKNMFKKLFANCPRSMLKNI